jgi:hypothetical protein
MSVPFAIIIDRNKISILQGVKIMAKKKYIKDKNGKFAGSVPEKPSAPKVSNETSPIPIKKIYEKENGQIGLAGKKFRDGRDSGIAYERNQVLAVVLDGIERISSKLIKEKDRLSDYDRGYLQGELDALKAVANTLTKPTE